MATEVNQNYFAWPQEESSVQDSSQGTPQVFDHGSISFGRFELESLAWEKWSVFTNDRRHEEFVKFNGLVAKKKAYFEEYFKRIRELKALQQENQQTELNLEYSGDGSDSSQTGEDEPAAEHGSPAGSGTLINDSMEHTAAETTPEHELECYKDHEYESLNNEISASTRSSPVRGLQLIGQEISENASGDTCSDRMDMLQQNANSSQDDLRMPHETTMTPKRTIEKNSRISQASKIIPNTVKMTSSNIPDNTVVNKGPDSGKSSVINLKAKPENIQSLRRAKAVISVVGITGRSKLMAKEAPGVVAVKRPSSAASQRPSTRERRPVTRDGPRKPAEIATPCWPCTAESCPATRGLAPKQGNIATPHWPSTADRRPITKELAPKHANIATPRRPSTAERRPITRDVAPKHAGIATPCRPSTAERRPVTTGTAHKHADVVTLHWSSIAERCPITKESAPKHANIATPRRPSTAERRPITRDVAPKHAGIATPCRPSTAERRPVTTGTAQKRADVVTLRGSSTAERRPITGETAQKHCDVVTLCRPSTAERRPVAREIAPKHANVAPPRRPSIAERRVVTRETALKHANVASPCWPSTPERRLSRESAPKHADIATTPRHPSTGQRHPIDIETTLQSDPITPFRLRAMPAHPKGAMATAVTPKKAITPNLVKSSSPEIKSYVKEWMEHQVDGIQKSSSVNLPTRKMLTSNVRANRVLENIRKPNKEGIQETVQCRASASKNVTPLQTGRRAPNPPPPPPLPHRPSQIASKPNPNKLSVGGRKPKASAPHWH